MAKQSLYEILGVPETCSTEEVEAASRQRIELMRGSVAGDELANQLAFVRYARELLADPVRRRQYDRQRVADASLPAASFAPVDDAATGSNWPMRVLGLSVVTLAVAGWARFASEPSDGGRMVRATAVAPRAVAAEARALPADAPSEAALAPREATAELAAAAPGAAPAGGYTISVDSADAELVKKLVWSVYAIVGQATLGSGILIDNERLLTNCHVLAGNILKGPIHAINSVTRERLPITEAAYLPNEDACLVVVPGLGGQTVALGSSAQLKVGMRLHNIGYPQGKLGSSEGVFTGWTNRHGQPFIVSSNYCAPGVSGGPLVDDEGRLIGLTTGGNQEQSRCASLTIETARQVLTRPLLAIDDFPRDYASNVSRRGH